MALRLKKSLLAKELGISRTTLDKYLARGGPKPDEKGEYDVEAVRRHASQRAAAARSGNTAVSLSPVEKLRTEKLEHELEHAKFLFAKDRGLYIHRDKIQAVFEPLVAALRSDLQKEFEDKLPAQYRGRSRGECQQLNAAAVDRIIANIRNGAAPVVPAEEKKSA